MEEQFEILYNNGVHTVMKVLEKNQSWMTQSYMSGLMKMATGLSKMTIMYSNAGPMGLYSHLPKDCLRAAQFMFCKLMY